MTQKTKYDTVLLFQSTPRCHVYSTAPHNTEVTLEDNLSSAWGRLRLAMQDRRKGVSNGEYVRYCIRSLREARQYIENAKVL